MAAPEAPNEPQPPSAAPTAGRPVGQSAKIGWSTQSLATNPHDAADKPERVQWMFNSIARTYDLNNRLHSFGMDQVWRKRTVREAGVTSTTRVLDVACGTGDLTFAFADAHPRPAQVMGADFAAEMLALAKVKDARRNDKRNDKRNAKRNGKRAPVTFLEADAQQLPFPDASFDVLSIAFGIRNVASTSRALREFHRVLAPGGTLLILEFGQPRNALLRWANRIYTERIMPITAGLIARDRAGAYAYLPRSVATYLTPEQLASTVRDAGFTVNKQVPMTFGVCVLTVART